MKWSPSAPIRKVPHSRVCFAVMEAQCSPTQGTSPPGVGLKQILLKNPINMYASKQAEWLQ